MAKKKTIVPELEDEIIDVVYATEVENIEVVEEVVVEETKEEKPKKEFTLYPLKKAIKVGNEIRPIGYNISLTKEGYKFYKQQNIV
jgi:hypothetical protein